MNSPVYRRHKITAEEGVEIKMLKRYIIKGWSYTKDRVESGLEKYWPVRHELAMIGGIAMRGKQKIIPLICKGRDQSSYAVTI